jgi:hypothetical protein
MVFARMGSYADNARKEIASSSGHEPGLRIRTDRLQAVAPSGVLFPPDHTRHLKSLSRSYSRTVAPHPDMLPL